MEAYKKSQSDEFSQLFQSLAAESAQHFLAGPSIITPLAQQQRNSKRKHDNDENDAVILPHPPATGIAMGEASSANLNFQQHFLSSQIKLNLGKDPREEFFKYSKGKNFGLQENQKVLAQKTVEQEEDEIKQQQQQE